MSNRDQERIDELVIDEWIWVVFIILSFLNIGGDELEKNYCRSHDYKHKDISGKIFKFTVFVSFIIYIYLAYKNYAKHSKMKSRGEDTSLIEVRCLGSTLVLIASLLFLYAQFHDKEPVNPSID